MKKYDLIKMAGWIAVAIGGLVASWATDKQSKEEIDKKLEECITEKTKLCSFERRYHEQICNKIH